MGADNSFYMKTIETHAGAFFKVIIFSIGNVYTAIKIKQLTSSEPMRLMTTKTNPESNNPDFFSQK